MERNRSMLASLLSTRSAEVIDAEAMLDLADQLEQEGFMLSGWQLDGPAVRVRFHGSRGELHATLSELSTAARALRAGQTSPWQRLLLQETPGVPAARPPSSEPLS